MEVRKLRRVTMTEFRKSKGHFMKQSELCPIVLTKRGRDFLVILSEDFYRELKGEIK